MNPILLFLSNYWEVKEPPARLRKKQGFWERHGTTILSIGLPALLIIAIIVFLLICFTIGGTESSLWFNKGLA